MYRDTKELYEFGPFRLDVTEHTLTRTDDSKNYILPEKAFQTLCVLVKKKGRLLTKQELMSEIWPDSFVEENNLDKCIHAIRQVLGEKPGEKKYIETVRKHGYRFVADVNKLPTHIKDVHGVLDSEFLNERTANGEAVSSSSITVVPAEWDREDDRKMVRETRDDGRSSTDSELPAVLQPQRTSLMIRSAIFVAPLFLAVAMGIGYFFYPAKSTTDDHIKEFAVLPVKPIDPANRSDIYEIGIADSLIQRLSSIEGFVVRPLSSTRKYTEIEQDPLAAGREQEVDYVLVSSYQIADGRIKLTSQLLNVATGKIEDTYQSHIELSSVFAVQDALAGTIHDKLVARFVRTDVRSPAKRGTASEEAYNYYLQGMKFLDERRGKKAIENLEQAVKLDPDYARAWANKAHAHLAALGGAREIGDEAQKTFDAINKALALDPNISEAYSALCHSKCFYEYDFEGAERECERALQLDPNSAMAHKLYATFLGTRGRHDEAFAEIERARELDPASFFSDRIYANLLYWARRYDEAVIQNQRILELNPNDRSRYNNLIWASEMQGNESEAFEWFIKLLAVQKRDQKTIERYTAVYGASGWRGVMVEREKEPDEFQLVYFRRAGAAVRLGNKDLAFQYLEKAYEERSWLIAFLQVDPQLDPLRDDPRYLDLVRRVESTKTNSS